MKNFILGMMGVSMLLLLFACKGGSSSFSATDAGTDDGTDGSTLDGTNGDDDSGVTAADEVGYGLSSQLVLVGNPDDSASASVSLGFGMLMASTNPATDDDYTKDETKEYIYDGTGDYLMIINQIFCSLGQTQYTSDQVMDQGVQIILVNTSQCASDYFYQTSGMNSADTYEEWLVDARTNDDGTATVYFRIKGNTNDMGSMGFWYDRIDGQLHITEGVSASNQIGYFDLNAAGYYLDEVIFNTALVSLPRDDGMSQLQFLMDYPSENYSFSSGVNAILDPSGFTGAALVNYTSAYDDPNDMMDAQVWDTTMQINYDAAHVRTAYASDGWDFEQCVDRNSKTETFVSYNLYAENSAGGLDRLDLNTGMSFKTANEFWGYAGPWGVSAGEPLFEDMVVTGGDGNSYTITVGDGMLMATIKEEHTFDLLTDKEIYGYDNTTWESYIMEWNGTEFVKIKTYGCTDVSCDYFDVVPAETITLAAGNYNYYVNGIGSVDFTVPDVGLSADSSFFVSNYEYLPPTDPSLQAPGFGFRCFYQCPKGGLTQDDITNSAVYYEDGLVHNYTLGEGFTLVEENDGVVTTASLDMSGSYYEWGFSSGPMVPADSTIVDPDEIYSSDAIYTWQVGTNDYNRYVGLLDSFGDAVAFDSYLSCSYENDQGTFLLQYYDQGQLFGIPYVSETDSETGFMSYKSQFRIPDRDAMTCDDGETYRAKAVYIQYEMDMVDNSACSALAVTALDRASIEFTNPTLPEMIPSAQAPAVIGGAVQGL